MRAKEEPMDIDQTTQALKVRRDLTGESFSDGTIAAWCEALGAWPLGQVRTAIVTAAREHQRVAVAHVAALLPQHARPPGPAPVACELCGGTGLVSSPLERAHDPRVCKPTEEHPCYCTATEPCRCKAGDAMRPVLARILEHNARTRPRHTTEGTR
jgi:hypothetical protein